MTKEDEGKKGETANPTGDRFSTNFLRLTALRAGGIPRTFQFGARFGF